MFSVISNTPQYILITILCKLNGVRSHTVCKCCICLTIIIIKAICDTAQHLHMASEIRWCLCSSEWHSRKSFKWHFLMSRRAFVCFFVGDLADFLWFSHRINDADIFISKTDNIVNWIQSCWVSFSIVFVLLFDPSSMEW